MRTHNLFSRLGLAMVTILLLSHAACVCRGNTGRHNNHNVATVQYNAGSNVRSGSSNIVTMVVGTSGYQLKPVKFGRRRLLIALQSINHITVTNSGNYADSLQFAVTHLPLVGSTPCFLIETVSGVEKPADS